MALGDPYVTASELADDFAIGDVDDHTQLENACSAATRWVTLYCRRDFNQAESATARTFYVHERDHRRLDVDDVSTTSGLVIKSDAGDDATFETTWTSDQYQLEPLNGIVDGVTGWPYTRIRFVETLPAISCYGYRPQFEVTATWGWAAVPDEVKRATSIMASRLFKRKDSPEGVLGGFGDFGAVRVGTRLDPDVEMLLNPYRKLSVLVA